MPDDLSREFEELERGIEVRIPVAPDADGYLDKECPSELCLFAFKVHEEDWRDRVSDDAVHCPMCGHVAPATSWWTTDQMREADRQALEQLEGSVDDAFRRAAKRFNSRQPRRGFMRVTMEVEGTPLRRPVVAIAGTEPFELRIVCDECATRFAVVGSAFFCPACGHSSATRVFEDSLKKVRLKADASDNLPAHYRELGLPDEGVVLARSLLETALSDCVVAFQRLCEQLYHAQTKNRPAPNAFQRLRDGSDLWRDVLGEGYEEWLPPERLRELNVLWQRRHLLQHTEGVVDQRYIERSGDYAYEVGQRIVVRRANVLSLADLATRLADALRSKLTGAEDAAV